MTVTVTMTMTVTVTVTMTVTVTVTVIMTVTVHAVSHTLMCVHGGYNKHTHTHTPHGIPAHDTRTRVYRYMRVCMYACMYVCMKSKPLKFLFKKKKNFLFIYYWKR